MLASQDEFQHPSDMAALRTERIDLNVTPYYHCISRCVRRAFLCGKDHYSGKNFEHRREWVRDRLRSLVEFFAIDVCAYAIMSNHVHLVLHVDKERAQQWSEAEVERRYTTLYPMSKVQRNDTNRALRTKLVATWRARLHDISWLMRSLNEYIARRANREDGVQGRFWEGRFFSQALLDQTGLLTCMAYVDLNPVRANMAQSIVSSDYTSLQERTLAKAKCSARRKQSSPVHLLPFVDQAASGQSTRQIAIRFDDYWNFVDAACKGTGTGTSLFNDHNLHEGAWLEEIHAEGLSKAGALGTPKRLQALAKTRGQSWIRGIGLARRLCTETSHQ